MKRFEAKWAVSMMLIVVLGLMAVGQEEAAQPDPLTFEQPVLITSIGQSAGAAQVRVVAIRAGVEATYTQRATLEELEGVATLVIVLGASSKGLGAAGVDVDGEMAWATELVETARDQGIQVIAMHIEGGARRGPSSDLIVTTFSAMSDYLIVKGSAPGIAWTADEAADGNADGLFTTIATDGEIPISYIETTLGAVDVFIELFAIEPAEG